MTDTRDRIINSTNELFRLHGYHGTSLSAISEASGATTGSIYHFFPGGKEGLAVAVIASTGSAYRELFETIAGGAADPVAAYRDFFAGAATTLVETDFLDPCPIGTVAREVASTSPTLRAAAQAAFESWVRAVGDHLRGAGVADDEAHELATLFVTTVEGCFVLCRTMRSTAPLEAASRHLVPLVDAAIARAPAG
ncbi:MAG: TetR/AcrR family transcriptional regulator [Actinomycetota bacterium]